VAASEVIRADIEEARGRIGGAVVRTSCLAASGFSDLNPARLHFKLENQQHTGSFKDRGALNKLLGFDDDERRRGAVTASAGNHAQALAYHGGRLGIPVTVVMPEAAPLVKVANTRRYGARVELSGSILDESAEIAREIARREGSIMVSAFDDDAVIAGQGTVGLEILEDVPDVATVVVPVGGGGLISGIGIAIKAVRPDVRLVGVEAEAVPSATASRAAGRVVKIDHAPTLADGIATKRIGDRTFPLMERYVDDLVTVSEDEIASAILVLLERGRTVVEGAGAVGVAALLAGKIPVPDEAPLVVVLSGGNIDMNRVSRIIDRGLEADGRVARLVVRAPDRPGSLARLTRVLADQGANVLETSHRRAFADIRVGDVEIVTLVETTGRDHLQAIIEALEAEGMHVRDR
jgi:threonine dehydratase